MKFFVDTAETSEIRDLAATGLLDGVTTNPSLIHKSGRKFLEVIAEICALVPGPVSAEVAATEFSAMMREAAVLKAIAPNVCIKVPLTPDGLRACHELSKEGTLVNVTLCFSAAQALLAAKAGAASLARLTPAEREFLDQLANGYAYKEIADRMKISIDTVRSYVRTVYEKLHVHSRTEAVVKYLRG